MKLLNKIQQELKVPKGQYNAFAKYNYRNAEDILEAVKPLLGDRATLTLSDEVVQVGERNYVRATATITDWDDMQAQIMMPRSISVTAYACESVEKKGMDVAQITGAASSYARKYALNGLFCIDDTKDADHSDNTKSEVKKPLQKPAALDPELKKKKVAIADLLKDNPLWLHDLNDKEDYEKACLHITGIELKDENVDAILKALLKD